MRILHVPAACLPTALLVQQHRTIHLLMEHCAKGDPITAYSNHAGFLVLMHHDCVRELKLRGGRHASPVADLYWKVPPRRRRVDRSIPPDRTALDIKTLAEKISERGCEGLTLALSRASYEFRRMTSITAIEPEWLTE